MGHLLIHLVDEAKLGGPVQYRWMYPIERYLAHLKSHVTNKAQPEGSIAEGYMLEETIMFCSRFLEDVKTIFNRPKRNDDDIPDSSSYLYNSGGRTIGKEHNVKLDDKSLKLAHRYVLLHCDEMKELLDECLQHKRQMSNLNVVTDCDESKWIINEYGDWLQNQAHCIDATEDGELRKALAGGLSCYGRRIKGLMINGYNSKPRIVIVF